MTEHNDRRDHPSIASRRGSDGRFLSLRTLIRRALTLCGVCVVATALASCGRTSLETTSPATTDDASLPQPITDASLPETPSDLDLERRRRSSPRPGGGRSATPSAEEEQRILDALHEPRFVDKAPAEVYATLLDEKVYLGSIRTFYRVLHKHQEVRERRALTQRPNYQRPELLATRPNMLWSWDITKLRGSGKWTYYYLYVILDVFSRYVVGWMVALRESEDLARELIATTCERQGIAPGQLTLHADRGAAMTSRSVAQMLTDLGVEKTHSRPHVSDDNPYSEAQFKTLKYRPDFPNRFGSVEDARAFCGPFIDWYNHEHHHAGLALLTPADVHLERAEERLAARDAVLAAAHAAHPERFVNKLPTAPRPPPAAWINAPKERRDDARHEAPGVVASEAGSVRGGGPPSGTPKGPRGNAAADGPQPEATRDGTPAPRREDVH